MASPTAVARLRQMARLDIQGPQFIAPVLRALHQVIGFDVCSYVHLGGEAKAQETQFHVEDPALAAAAPDYFDPRIQRSEREIFHWGLSALPAAIGSGRGPLMLEQLLKVPRASLLRSDFYDTLLRPAGVADWISLALHTPQGQGVGTLSLYRRSGSPRFQQKEVDALAPLQACLAHVLQPPAQSDTDDSVAAQASLVTAPGGRLLWLEPQAETLMARAFGLRWRTRAAFPPALHALLRRLEPGASQPPQMELRNASGRFSLRAGWLMPAGVLPEDAGADGAGPMVHIAITQHVARAARQFSALQARGLPHRQHELAWWLVRGLSEQEAAARMCISANTVVYHRRQLYNRLGVQERRELLEKLAPP
ncbi:DNA-binding CsgD family transcriptional regulator [Variovorax boronicumulans]|uniref:helix-turn-helix transcriptional regulator n=1 Tax=Variovorax boronicumulans TaxID=436515 RepID=UPI002789DAF4|nr:helix-turn-helix transcriptional regulator [Variovorax boronicumulans]MDP9917488.1 DNA-binding CsgD family transcriptional regulator [Variovorax boronicumulans]